MTLRTRIVVAALLAGLCPLGAGAGDGRLEINQACAEGDGCFPGDTPGWPVTIDETGSYLLTSHLQVPDENTTAIELTGNADRTSIDLAGFQILGVTQCFPLSNNCSPLGSGVGVLASSTTFHVIVRNGFVRGMGGHGIWLQNRDYVRDVIVSGNGGIGIEVGPFSSVIDCQAVTNGGAGIKVDETTVGAVANAGNSILRGNLSGNNGIVDSEALDIEGSRTTGGNICMDGHCSSNGAKRYYLSSASNIADGANASTSCAAGYHMASIFELLELAELQYANVPQRGVDSRVSGDGETGPPVNTFGWVRTGHNLSAGSNPGQANCAGYTETAATGTYAYLQADWLLGGTPGFGPWLMGTRDCDVIGRTWCIEN